MFSCSLGEQVEVFCKVCLEGTRLAGKSVKVLVDAGIVKGIPDLYTMSAVSQLYCTNGYDWCVRAPF